jgi:hypothetical protein
VEPGSTVRFSEGHPTSTAIDHVIRVAQLRLRVKCHTAMIAIARVYQEPGAAARRPARKTAHRANRYTENSESESLAFSGGKEAGRHAVPPTYPQVPRNSVIVWHRHDKLMCLQHFQLIDLTLGHPD